MRLGEFFVIQPVCLGEDLIQPRFELHDFSFFFVHSLSPIMLISVCLDGSQSDAAAEMYYHCTDNMLLIGPPGTGKSMLTKRLPTILPPLTLEEALETTKIHRIVGLLAPGQVLVTQRPFRAPHHTACGVF